MKKSTKAGKNEYVVALLLSDNAIPLSGKKRYARGGVEISTDNSFEREGVLYLVEVDSGNVAKTVAGQYILLNQLCPNPKDKTYFLIVHTFKKYNPNRTKNALSLINNEVYAGRGIQHGAIHLNELQDWGGDFTELLSLAARSSS